MRHLVRFVAVCSLFSLIVLCPEMADAGKRSITISEQKKGGGLVVTVSQALAREVFESAIGTELDCGSDLDPDFEKLLRTLDRGGRGTRATLRTGDTTVHALRKNRSITFDIKDRDGDGSIKAVVPWAIAECLLGRATRVGDSLGPVKVKITGEGGGSFEFEID